MVGPHYDKYFFHFCWRGTEPIGGAIVEKKLFGHDVFCSQSFLRAGIFQILRQMSRMTFVMRLYARLMYGRGSPPPHKHDVYGIRPKNTFQVTKSFFLGATGYGAHTCSLPLSLKTGLFDGDVARIFLIFFWVVQTPAAPPLSSHAMPHPNTHCFCYFIDLTFVSELK